MATIIDFSTRKVVATTPRLCGFCSEPVDGPDSVCPGCVKAYDAYRHKRWEELGRRPARVPGVCSICGGPVDVGHSSCSECQMGFIAYLYERDERLNQVEFDYPAMSEDEVRASRVKTWVIGDEETYILFITSPDSYKDHHEKTINEVVQVAPELRPYKDEIVSTVKRRGRFYKVIAGVQYEIIQANHPF